MEPRALLPQFTETGRELAAMEIAAIFGRIADSIASIGWQISGALAPAINEAAAAMLGFKDAVRAWAMTDRRRARRIRRREGRGVRTVWT